MKCKNCDHLVTENFCPHCGQNIKVDKINLPYFLSQFSDSIFQINRGLFYTMKELFVRPGYTIKEYLIGKRKKHFKPIAYAFTLSTIYFLLSQLMESETYLNDALIGFINGASGASSGSELESSQLTILTWFVKNYAYTVLFLLPIYSFVSYLTFKKSGFNYLEHFVLNAYIIGQQAIFYSISSLFTLVITNEDFLVQLTLFISISYAFFVFFQFFSDLNRVSIILRFIFTYILYLIFLMLVSLVLFSIIKLTN